MASKLLKKWLAREWYEELDFNKVTGDFHYRVYRRDGTQSITVLEGNAAEYKQDERNRARLFAYRLVDCLNAL